MDLAKKLKIGLVRCKKCGHKQGNKFRIVTDIIFLILFVSSVLYYRQEVGKYEDYRANCSWYCGIQKIEMGGCYNSEVNVTATKELSEQVRSNLNTSVPT